METGRGNETSGDGNMNTINMGSVGMALPVTSGIDPSVNTGTISVPCSVGDAGTQQPQHIQISGTAMSIGSLAVAMGLSGTNTDPNSLSFTSNALATLSARMGMSSVASTNTAGLMATGNSLLTFPGNLVPGVGMNIPGGGAGVSIVDGSGLNMAVAGGLAMQASNVNVVGVQTSSNHSGSQQQQGNLLQNSVHINSGSNNVSLMNSASGGHSAGCCGGCRTRVTVKDQSSQTDLSTVIQV